MELKIIMEDLDLSFLNVLLLTHGITEKIVNKFYQSKLSRNDFINEYPSYADLNQLMYQSAILQARKLWETKLFYNLTEDEWLKISDWRHEIVHSEKKDMDRLQ